MGGPTLSGCSWRSGVAPNAVMVPKTNAVPLGGRKKRIEQHVERLPEEAFSEVRPARDSSGRRPWEWACLDLAADSEKGMRRWLLVRKTTDNPEDRSYYQAYGPEGTPIEELVRVCQERWAVEECFAEAKGEVGLDHYEVRRWDAWYRHPVPARPRLPGHRLPGRPQRRRRTNQRR